MKNLLLAVLLVIGLPVFGEEKKVAEHLQDISVTIRAIGGQGSGVIITRGDESYVWTAAHVVSANRVDRRVVDVSNGQVRHIISYIPVSIIKEYIENGDRVGSTMLDADIIRYSDAEVGEDLALLKIKKKKLSFGNTKFYLEADIPQVGTDLYHCGNLLGQVGANSVTTGIYSQIGRNLFGKTFDQISCAAFPGSSGGGVFTKDGVYVGMLVRGAGETFHLMVPVRRMKSWAKKNGVEFALDDTLPVKEVGPSEDLEGSPSVD